MVANDGIMFDTEISKINTPYKFPCTATVTDASGWSHQFHLTLFTHLYILIHMTLYGTFYRYK